MSEGKVAKKRPKPTIGETFLSRTVTVKIGPELKDYQVHKPLIMHHSEFFRAAFASENFKEGVSGEVTLEDVNPAVFEAFIDWLYTQKLLDFREWDKYGGEHSLIYNGMHVTQLYVLANRIIAPELTKTTLELAVDYFNSDYVSVETIIFAYANLPEEDIYLQLLVDEFYTFFRKISKEDVNDEDELLPTKFLRGVINKYALLATTEQKSLEVENYLHVFNDNVPERS
ncbi:hypothetical protein P171DRAFT_446355 [Karstenula rhodostoma CBS 690.94]|uniref:BTB domain-containing protein n=1 Tax=Karstenula rhodostoma CBS 690.94 TaxID=1392251 RepID=A0A9P4U8R4_9PLEO|nr:hypothetical protein P171DRAFT_446355 [Karstenula rhodostoma CBS 690.94]